MTQLKASKANVLMVFAFREVLAAGVQRGLAASAWKPQIFVNDVSSASALMAIVPAEGCERIDLDRVRQGSRVATLAVTTRASSSSSRSSRSTGRASTHATCRTATSPQEWRPPTRWSNTLKKAGKNLTRQSVMNAATHLNERANPFVLPGIVIHTTPSSRFPLTQVRLQRWSNNSWHPFGKLISAKP